MPTGIRKTPIFMKYLSYYPSGRTICPKIRTYTRGSLQRESRASECSLHQAREGTPSYPTCCYARYCFNFERALSHSNGGRGVNELLFVGNYDALV